MLPKVALAFLLTLTLIKAAPPTYPKQRLEKSEESPPKYNYQYTIQIEKDAGQGKTETRDGVVAGRYYVQGKNFSQNVEYVSDELGYHPYVEWSNVGPHSHTIAQIALDSASVKALRGKNYKVPDGISAKPQSSRLVRPHEDLYKKPPKPIIRHNFARQTKRPVEGVRSTPLPLKVENKTNEKEQEIPDQENSLSNQQQVVFFHPVHEGQPLLFHHNVELQTEPSDIVHVTPNVLIPIQHQQKRIPTSNKGAFLESTAVPLPPPNPSKWPFLQSTIAQPDPSKGPFLEPTAIPFPRELHSTALPNLERESQILANGRAVFLQTPGLILQQPFTYTAFPYQHEPIIILQDQVINGHQHHLPQENAERPVETAALYESSANNLDNSKEDEQALNSGNYGSKTNVNVPPNSRPNFDKIKELVTGQDVLDINNQAVSDNIENVKSESTTAPTAIVSEYAPANIRQKNFINKAQPTSTTPPPSTTEDFDSLSKRPIVVPDLESDNDNIVSSTPKEHVKKEATTESTIDITPRPVSSNFLAPITAGVQLQSGNVDEDANSHENILVDIQKSIPYYLGKIEYYDQPKHDKNGNITASATQHIQLGGFLQFPMNLKLNAKKQHTDQIQAQGQHQPIHLVPEKTSDSEPTKVSIEVTKYVDNPNEVPVAMPVQSNRHYEQSDVSVQKSIPMPEKLEVEKIIEKPVYIAQTVEKKVEVPVEVTRYIDRPYPVPVEVPKPVPYPVEVEKVVEKYVQQPYPVEVRIPVQIPVHFPIHHQSVVEKKVPVVQYVERPVEKQEQHYVHKPFPVAQTYYIPVEVQKPYPVKFVNKPYPVQRPYPVQYQTIEFPFAQPIPIDLRVPHAVPVQVPKFYNRVVDRPYQTIFVNGKLGNPLHHHKVNNQNLEHSASYQSAVKIPCVDLSLLGIKQPYCGPTTNNYVGLVPPKLSLNSTDEKAARKARQNLFDNVKWEYGFMPPFLPSLAIDEHGNPVEKHTK